VDGIGTASQSNGSKLPRYKYWLLQGDLR